MMATLFDEETIMAAFAKEMRDEGIEKGQVSTFYSLVKDKLLTPEVAATKLNVTINELEKLFEKYGLEPVA